MQVKRYEAMNMREAMARIKNDLGPDAIILSTKKASKDGSLIEVMAARDRELACAETDRICTGESPVPQGDSLNGLRQEIRELRACISGLSQRTLFSSDLYDLKEAVNILCDAASMKNASHLQQIYRWMAGNGISRVRALRVMEHIKNDFPSELTDTYEKASIVAEKLIAGSFLKDDYRGLRIKAFIGPTGVGKTTTLAKLAAHYCLNKKMKVGLITTDTYRIAATEQLKIYAKIMGLPLAVASDAENFSHSLRTFADRDMILVDTPGRSHLDERCLKTLKSILSENVETFLLLTPMASKEYLLEAADRFRIFNYDRLILTKLDECSIFGTLLDVLETIGKPVSYMTTGQNVPNDIAKADPERLAKLTLQNRLH
jgi:flagellar biosynthesis protein FlhF